MVTLAKILSISSDKKSAEVDIVKFSQTPLSKKWQNVTKHTAQICNYPGFEIEYSVNELVYVAFENNNNSKPVILGKKKAAKPHNSKTNGKIKDLTVTSKADFSSNVTFNLYDSSNKDVKNLKIKLQNGITINNSDIEKLHGINELKNRKSEQVTIKQKFKENDENINKLIEKTSILRLEKDDFELDNKKIPNIILQNKHYGKELPKKAEKGQLFFKLIETDKDKK